MTFSFAPNICSGYSTNALLDISKHITEHILVIDYLLL